MADDLKILIDAVWEGQREVLVAIRDLWKLDNAAEDTGKGITKMDLALGDFIGGALTKVADFALEGARALVDYGVAAAGLAADFGETTSLLDTYLGPAVDGFRGRIDALAEATGRSSNAIQSQAATLVAMTSNMGLAQNEAANLSAEFSAIALDLGSAFNRDTVDVFADIQSFLSGSAETMDKYGLDLKAATLQQFAFEIGLIDTNRELTKQERALAGVALIQEQATIAMGDAARTADSAANKQKALEDAYFDLQLQIGEQLLPVQEALVESQLKLVQLYGDDLVAAVGETVSIFEDLQVILGQIGGLNIDRGSLLWALDQATFGGVTAFIQARNALGNIADDARAQEQALETVNAYYIGLGLVAEAEREAAAANQERIAALQAADEQTRVEDLVNSYEHLFGVKSQAAEREGRAVDQLQEQQERLANIESTNALLERQAAARRDRERETLEAIIAQQGELTSLFDIGDRLSSESAATLLFEEAQAQGLPIGAVVELAEATGRFSDEAIEAATDAALYEQAVRDMTEAIAEGLPIEQGISNLEAYRLKLIENKDNAGDLIDELDEVYNSILAISGDTQGTITITVQGLQELREAAALQAGLTGFNQLAGLVGGPEAQNITDRQFGAGQGYTVIPPTRPTGTTGRGESQGTARQ